MVECGQCGETLDNLAYSCNYCGQANCSDHRLPEKHDCIALHLTRPPESSKAEADAHLGDPRNFRGEEDFVEWVEAFRDRHSPGSDEDDDTEGEVFRDALEDAEASEETVEQVVENVQTELESPEEKPYSVFEPKYTVGTQPDPDFSSSPDVAPDGSIKTEGVRPDSHDMARAAPRGFAGIPRKYVALGAIILVLALLVFFL